VGCVEAPAGDGGHGGPSQKHGPVRVTAPLGTTVDCTGTGAKGPFGPRQRPVWMANAVFLPLESYRGARWGRPPSLPRPRPSPTPPSAPPALRPGSEGMDARPASRRERRCPPPTKVAYISSVGAGSTRSRYPPRLQRGGRRCRFPATAGASNGSRVG